jgi:putative membrane protein
MKAVWTRLAVIGAAVVLLPLGMRAQTGMDPTANPANPMNPAIPVPPQPGPMSPTGAQQQPPMTMRDTLGAPGMTGQQMKDKQFLMKAAEGGMAEVQLGMLATQKGGPEVKEFGQKMVDDHTAINKDMGTVADQLGVMLPKRMNKDDKAEYDKLSGLSGDEFDKEYIAYMIKDHRQDIREFFMEARAAADPALQTEAGKAAGVIRGHLQMVTKLAEEKGVPVPPRPPRPGPPAGQ